jgi:hypothetical protein
VINVTWSLSCQTPPAEAVATLEYAAGLWGTWISSTVPIEVTACWTSNLSGGDALGSGTPTEYAHNFSKAPLLDTHYPIALANALNGSDMEPALADMTLQFDANAMWSFEITTTLHTRVPTAGEDFVAVALHELAHGLGFIGNMYENGSVGFCGDGPYGYLYPCPTPYDQFVVDSQGTTLLNYHTVNPIILGTRLKDDTNFGGPNAVAANGGTAAKLMTPSYSGVTRHPGPVTLAILQDMGWLRADGIPNVTTSGPLVVGVSNDATFTGTLVWSGYTGQPITYTWATTNQVTVTHPSLTNTDSATLSWDTPGEKRVTLTATDGAASASAVRAALVFGVDMNGPAQGDTNHAYTFNADVTPAVLSFPVTYTWQATDQTNVVHPGQSTTDSAAFTWTTPGTKTITATAAIAGATAQSVHTIAIEGIVLDQFIFLPLVQRSF